MKHVLILFAVCIFVLGLSASAQVPHKISYQGLLTTSSGKPVHDGDYELKFDFYNKPAEGTLRYSETHGAVPVERGSFSIILGPLPAIFSESLYVEVTAVSGPDISEAMTFSPRSELTSAPYAIHSSKADTALVGILTVSDTLWDNSVGNIYRLNGNVGLGTSTPSQKLEINGNLKVNGSITDRVWSVKLSSPTDYSYPMVTLCSLQLVSHGGTLFAIGKLVNVVPKDGYRNHLYLYRDTTLIDEWYFWTTAPGAYNESAVVMATENLEAGTYTYYLKADSEAETRTAIENITKLTVIEY